MSKGQGFDQFSFLLSGAFDQFVLPGGRVV